MWCTVMICLPLKAFDLGLAKAAGPVLPVGCADEEMGGQMVKSFGRCGEQRLTRRNFLHGVISFFN